MRDFNSLDEREVLALAISLEEEDERIYADFADRLKADFPASAAIFEGMGGEESVHRRRLLELFRQKFGDHIPLIRRQDVRGFVQRSPVWLAPTLRVEKIRAQASAMEQETRRFWESLETVHPASGFEPSKSAIETPCSPASKLPANQHPHQIARAFTPS